MAVALRRPTDLVVRDAVHPQSCPWEPLLAQLKTLLACAGFDVAAPLCVDWYNQVAPEPVACTGSKTLAVLVGNNKNLWRLFLEACARDSSLLQVEDPLDTYVEREVQAAAHATGHKVRIFWGHQEADAVLGGPCLELQRMAAVAGLSFWDPSSYLSLHPKYGPWFALRAVILFDGIEYTGPKPQPLQNPMSPATQAYVRMAVRSACSPRSDSPTDSVNSSGSTGGVGTFTRHPSLPPKCQSSSLLCAKAKDSLGDQEAAQIQGGEQPSREAVAARWQRWVAVRDAPCPGHPWRYPREQLEYHYTGRRSCLLPRRQLRGVTSAHF